MEKISMLGKYGDNCNLQNSFYNCGGLVDFISDNPLKPSTLVATFRACSKLKKIPDLDLIYTTNANEAFYHCDAAEGDYEYNAPVLTQARMMFYYCSKMNSIKLNCPKIETAECMFDGCSSVTNIEITSDLSALTNAVAMFRGNSKITSFSIPAMPIMTNAGEMFKNCSKVKTIELADVHSITALNQAFYNCSVLETITGLNSTKITNFKQAFYGCNSLNDDTLNKILSLCINATSYTGTKTLNELGFTNTSIYPVSRFEALDNYQAFIDAGWIVR